MINKNIHWICCLSILYASACEAQDTDSMTINSETASYNGNKVHLSGHVNIEHDLGNLEAEHMTLTPEKKDHKVVPKQLAMTDDVMITLRDGSRLSCQCAEIDFMALHGIFSGNQDHEYVTYTELCKDNSGNSVPVVVKSRSMAMRLAADRSTARSLKSSLSEIVAENDVSVNYNNDFMAAADLATYQRLPGQDKPDSKSGRMPGLIALRANHQQGTCQITNRNKDMITADNVCIDTERRTLFFAYPKGALYMQEGEGQRERIDFSSDTMEWEEASNVLTLSEHVAVHYSGIGTLHSDKVVKLTQANIEGKRQLETIESTGTTTLRYMEKDKEIAHILTCYGTVCVDHKNLRTTLESPKTSVGPVARAKQVSFHDHMGEIYADRMTIDYGMHNNALKPTRLTLQGNVHLLNRCTAEQSPEDFVQYAIADEVEYSPQAKEITLSAQDPSRVLFFDKINNLQVSAPALKIRRDEVTKKEAIQGVGNVRFTFLKAEQDKMASQFPMD